jgi:hypothetical protein
MILARLDPINPKVYWGDGKGKEMEGKESTRLDLNHGSPS